MQEESETGDRKEETIGKLEPDNQWEPLYIYSDIHFDPTGKEKSVCSRRPALLLNFTSFEDLVTCNECLHEMELALLEESEGRYWVGRDGKVYPGYPSRKTLGEHGMWIEYTKVD